MLIPHHHERVDAPRQPFLPSSIFSVVEVFGWSMFFGGTGALVDSL